ncbi:UDP-3-O-acyl-N-acetylglucosamine deacetylase [Oceanibacterium hippocampi]|nr:UDP-3-O-acyl-N-acetylglucosamine deacetylase [Oceanibacterium hippocampi]
MFKQKTIKNEVACSGIGLHCGREVSVLFRPAPENSGIRFVRSDLRRNGAATDDCMIEARYTAVADTMLCTTLGNPGGAKVATVEHLLAALSGLGIDNLVIELDGPEVPAVDGSSAPFVALLEGIGLVRQDAVRRYIRIERALRVEDGERFVAVEPADGFEIGFRIRFRNPHIGEQSCRFELSDGVFQRELAGARTFGLFEDVSRMKAMGLAQGGSLDNAVVVGDDGVMNEDGLRFGNEFVRHKALDAIGDLYLAGAPILGRFHGDLAGHSLNVALLQALFADETAWSYVDGEGNRLAAGAPWPSSRAAAPAHA